MRKQIFTVAMCLALTTIPAFANGAKTTLPNKSVVQVKSIQPQITASKMEQPKTFMTKDDAKKYFEAKRAKERELMYAALNLSAEQKAKAEALDAKTKTEAAKYIKAVRVEAKKLRELKTKKASIFAIYKQKWALYSAKSNADKFFRSSRKEFEAILTNEQKAKFKLIDDAKRKEMEKFRKEHKLSGVKGHYGPKSMGPSPSEIERPMGPPPPGAEFMGPPSPSTKDKK